MSETTSTGAWREVLALFERWLAAGADERRALIDDLKATRPDTLPRLLAMIEADRAAQSQDFLGESAPLAAGIVGTRLGAWELREPIGAGGMGQVWLATRGDGLYSGRAAVKLLHSTRAGAQADARFAREGELLARLAHPHIAQLLDAGLAEDGTRYLVLEHVQGERIDRWCDTRALRIDARLRLFVQVCEAVSYAHAHLVVHRDLKPANILVTDEGHVKLLDFGVAKLLGDDGQASDLTRAGSAGLTPEYASPEQVNGQAITTATDVYALGVLLFGLLSGRRPYGSTASTPAQLAREIVEAEPVALDAVEPDAQAAVARGATPARLQQALRGDLAQIVALALRKAPSERYASVQALADDLARHLGHAPVRAQAPGWRYRSAKFVRRHRVGVAAAALVGLAVVAGITATAWQAERAREQAVLARSEAAKATAIKDFLLGIFEHNRVGSGDVDARGNTTARQLLEQGATQALADRSLPPDVRGELLGTLSHLHDNLGLVAQADALSAGSMEATCIAVGPGGADCVDAMVSRAHVLKRMGRAEQSSALLRDAIARAERDTQVDCGTHGMALYSLGHADHLAGDMDAALQHLGRAVRLMERCKPGQRTHTEALRWLGNTQIVREEFDAAIATFRTALPLAEQQRETRDFSVGVLEYALGDAMSSAGMWVEGRPHREQGIALMARALGEAHPNVGMARAAHAAALSEIGKREQAGAQLARAAEGLRDDSMAASGNLRDRLDIATASMRLLEGDLTAGLAANTPLLERHAGSGAQTRGATLMRQTELQLLAGEPAQAAAVARQALEVIDRQIGATSIAGKHARVVLGEALAATAAGQDEARRLFEETLGPARADRSAAAPPALVLQRLRAKVGLAALSLPQDPARALALAREAAGSIAADTPLVQARIAVARARIVEGRALHRQGNTAAARLALEAALGMLTTVQVASSPRLTEARRALAALTG